MYDSYAGWLCLCLLRPNNTFPLLHLYNKIHSPCRQSQVVVKCATGVQLTNTEYQKDRGVNPGVDDSTKQWLSSFNPEHLKQVAS